MIIGLMEEWNWSKREFIASKRFVKLYKYNHETFNKVLKAK